MWPSQNIWTLLRRAAAEDCYFTQVYREFLRLKKYPALNLPIHWRCSKKGTPTIWCACCWAQASLLKLSAKNFSRNKIQQLSSSSFFELNRSLTKYIVPTFWQDSFSKQAEKLTIGLCLFTGGGLFRPLFHPFPSSFPFFFFNLKSRAKKRSRTITFATTDSSMLWLNV